MKKGSILAAAVILGLICLFGLAACTLGDGGEITDDNWSEWTTLTAPTCEDEGVEVRVSLKDASVTETRTVAAKGHAWGEWAQAVAPTCTFTGTDERICSECGNKDMRASAALGHSFGEWESVTEPTCLTNGKDRRVCLICANEESRTVYALGHDYSEWVIDTQPTCTDSGVEKRICRSDNAHAEYRPIEALGHNWGAKEVILAPTCESDGEAVRTCENDSAHKINVTIIKSNHNWSEYVTTTSPTESEKGVETSYCVNDAAHTRTRTAYATGTLGLQFLLSDNQSYYRVIASGYDIGQCKTLYIPEFHKGLPVKEVFRIFNMPSVEEVVFIGNTNVRYINDFAFNGMTNLKKIVLPDKITSIGYATFRDCINLKAIDIPDSVKLIDGAFDGCVNLESVNLPTGLEDIPILSYIFQRCDKLKELTMQGINNKYIVEGNCVITRDTKELVLGCAGSVIPDYVETIRRNSFSTVKLDTIFIPKNVKSISSAFVNCAALNEVIFESGSMMEAIDHHAFGLSKIKRITIPKSVKSIGAAAFDYCENLTEVKFEEGSALTKIENSTFDNCTALTNIELPKSVKEIGSKAFNGCVNLSVIELSSDITAIGSNAFNGFTPSQTIIINGVSAIEEANALWGEEWRANCYAEIVFRP